MVQLVGEHRENHIGLMPMVFVPLPLAVPIVAFFAGQRDAAVQLQSPEPLLFIKEACGGAFACLQQS
jgi:hypothetical protein